ncbi:MAG: 50S ribosomal protein L21 [Flavobacteriales bacterium]|nr:50S ribosomal protein L21 [Flavobacteriales bacterium]MCX7769290.1 50S ribosomal protein L21 [Flavobacteriales bacterium]MDW8410552.1 50S ribosomal protein L21 [Flavobacteriales bacterium]
MFAVVEIAGQQFKVSPGQQIFVQKLEAGPGTEVEFSKVLLLNDGTSIQVGKPQLEGRIVKAKVLNHVKGDKVLVFKKKRRKGYQKLNGHRQNYTHIEITSIK